MIDIGRSIDAFRLCYYNLWMLVEGVLWLRQFSCVSFCVPENPERKYNQKKIAKNSYAKKEIDQFQVQ